MTIRLPVGQKLTWNAQAIAMLGAISDVKLGKMLGIASHTVGAKRHELNIEPWREPKRRHTGVCEVCGETFTVVGGRLSRLRRTCPPAHPFTRPGQPSDHEKQLRSATLKLTHHNQPSMRGLIKNLGGSSVIRLLDD